MEENNENVLVYIGRSINRAIDFMVDRAWFDLVSVTAAVFVPESPNFNTAFHRVIFVLTLTIIMFIIRESIKRVHKTSPT